MRVNWQSYTNSYNPGKNKFSKQANNPADRMRNCNDRGMARNDRGMSCNDSVISSTINYSKQLREQRESAKDASLEKKKLRYQFKDISSQIIRSKTSVSARKAVSSARRELLRLKKEKSSGKYDAEEIDAAIAHAKAMECVARKKVRHLEEEEMLKAAGGLCSGYMEEKEDVSEDERTEEYEAEEYEAEEYEAERYEAEEYEAERYEVEEYEAEQDYFSDMDSELMEVMEEDLQEIEEGMQDMLELMGLDELSDSMTAAKGDADPADLKMMKIKHRNKEMKDMVKADSEYLKAVFKYLEKMKSGGTAPIGASSAEGPNMSSNTRSGVVQNAIPNAIPGAMANIGIPAAIDISL